MKNLDLLQEKLEISQEEMPEYEDVVRNVKTIIDQNQIHFKENPEIAFYAHIINFARRLKENENLTMTFEEYRKEINQDIYQMADQIVRQICDRYESEMDPSEVILVAIHIQATLV
ncbi:MAG: PRD domain-containing protein [Anaerolineaceae bacterium]|jgi:transcriptional regulatory protein LevR|nr:PRD domain-containing protein [Anaerolineaceae bacterium]